MTRPPLDQIPVSEALPPRPGAIVVTMARGQWDALLAACYEAGDVLLELDEAERPVAAYRRAGGHA